MNGESINSKDIPLLSPNIVGQYFPSPQNDSIYGYSHGSIHGSSPPFCICRNRERYTIVSNGLENKLPIKVLRQQVWEQTQYCMDRLVENHIPSYLLYQSIWEDRNQSKQNGSIWNANQENDGNESTMMMMMMTNCVLSCRHGNRSLLIHSGGVHLDTIVLRDIAYCLPHNTYHEPGFSLNLGQGSSLRDIQLIGMSSFQTTSHILTRTASELIHLKTTDIIHELSCDHNDKLNYIESGLILEPIQKWLVPFQISAMSSSQNSWPYAGLITTTGIFYSWNPNRGIVSASGNKSIFPVNIDSSICPKISCSSHPQCFYVTQKDTVYVKDIRSQSTTSSLFKLSSDNHIKSIVSYPKNPSPTHQERNIIISYDTNRYPLISLLDIRCGGKSIADRIMPESHESMKLASCSDFVGSQVDYDGESPDRSNSSQGILLCASASSRQIYAHSINHTGIGVMDGCFGVTNNNLLSIMSGSVSSSGQKYGSVSWETIGFPVVDRNDKATLVGFDVIPCARQSIRNDYRSKGEGGVKEEFSDSNSNSDNDEEDDSDSENSSNNYSKSNQEKKMKHRIHKFERNDFSYNAILAQQSIVGDVYLQRILIRDCFHPKYMKSFNSLSSSSNIIPPVQMGLPPGMKFHSVARPATNYSKVWKHDKAWEGLTLEKSISNFDLIEGLYPVPSSSFLPYIPEQNLRGFELWSLHPKIMRSDLSSHTRTLLRKAWNQDKTQRLLKRLVVDVNKNINQITDEQIFKGMMSNYLKTIETHPLTLWETWRYVFEVYRKAIDMKILLAFLRQQNELEEYYVRLNDSNHSIVTFDDLRVESEHKADRLFSRNYDQVSNKTNDECKCMESAMNDGIFSSLILSSENNIYPNLCPCSRQDCILPHLIVFKKRSQSITSILDDNGDGNATNLSSQTSIGSSNRQSTRVTADMITSLRSFWDHMM